MNAAPVQGIVFDKDGTLFDFATTWEAFTVAFLMRITGRDQARAAQIGQAIGFDLNAHQFARDSIVIAGTPAEIAQAIAAHVPDMTHAALVEMLNLEAQMAPQAEAVDLGPFLEGLRARGLALGVATNDAEAPARAHLDTAQVTGHFDFIAGFDSGFGGKPAPGQLLGFCAAMGLPPENVVMVGDSLHDLKAGRAAGMRTVGVLTGVAQAHELTDWAEAVFPDIGHIPDWLDRMGAAEAI